MTESLSPADVQLAARLVVEGLLPEATVRAVLAKAEELAGRGRPLSVAEICRRKGWISASEARWLVAIDPPPADLVPGIELSGMLGQGGMSRVYAGIDAESGAPVAVKILHPRLRRDERALATFRTEAELLMSLEHENIVQGYYHFEHDGLVYLVMEKVEGRSVQEHLDDAGRFPEDAGLYIILQCARALTALHARGLVHRDVKPGNILIDGENRVKLCDLGLAVEAGGKGGETTAGTVHYLAPEQARGEGGIDSRSDIYALGVTLFQLTIGRLPFEGETDEETMAQRLLDELRSPELKAMNVSPHLHYFIQKMMARDREVRYQDPEALISDIEEQIRGRKTLDAQPGRKNGGSLELEKPFQSGGGAAMPPRVGPRGRRPGRRRPR